LWLVPDDVIGDSRHARIPWTNAPGNLAEDPSSAADCGPRGWGLGVECSEFRIRRFGNVLGSGCRIQGAGITV